MSADVVDIATKLAPPTQLGYVRAERYVWSLGLGWAHTSMVPLHGNQLDEERPRYDKCWRH